MSTGWLLHCRLQNCNKTESVSPDVICTYSRALVMECNVSIKFLLAIRQNQSRATLAFLFDSNLFFNARAMDQQSRPKFLVSVFAIVNKTKPLPEFRTSSRIADKLTYPNLNKCVNFTPSNLRKSFISNQMQKLYFICNSIWQKDFILNIKRSLQL